MTQFDFRSVVGQYVSGRIDPGTARRLLTTGPAAAPPTPAVPAATPGGTMEIAVIGMSGMFPGASDIDEFWRNLAAGVVSLGELPPPYLAPDGSGYRWGGALAERDCFDPAFFDIPATEAHSMSPHQRLLLQEGWRALEHAGYDPRSLAGSDAGVFVGAEPTGFRHETMTGASDAVVAARLAYLLDLRGPAFVANTACSSSLVALHLACRSLQSGETSLAIVGGVCAGLTPDWLTTLAQSGMLSPTGRCRSFDDEADGTVFGEAVAVVVVKRLADALADGDHVHGVIRATGINQDGASNGITAPNGAAQERLIRDVHRRHGVPTERLGYVEAHGTATKLGDPVEANALVRALGDRPVECAVGTAKAYVGHTGAAAGLVGLIKVLLSMRHGRLVGMPGFARLNRMVDLSGSTLRIDDRPVAWTTPDAGPRLAAVTSLGISGTNAHVVVEEHPVPEEPPVQGSYLVPLSARDGERLRESARRLARVLEPRAVPEADPTPQVRALVAEVLGVAPRDIEPQEPFDGYGIESSQLDRLAAAVEVRFGVRPRVNGGWRTTDLARSVGTPERSGPPVALDRLAATLQTGRTPLPARVVFLVDDIVELRERLTAFADGVPVPDCWQGTGADVDLARLFGGDDDLGGLVATWLGRGKLAKVAELWARGIPVDWRAAGPPRRRLPLPTYPFARERYGPAYHQGGLTGHLAPAAPDMPVVAAEPVPVETAQPVPVETAPVQAAPVQAAPAGPVNAAEPPGTRSAATPVDPDELRRAVERRLLLLTAETVGLDVDQLDPTEPLDPQGVDSIARTRMNHQLAVAFPGASHTLLFEYADLASLAGHLVAEFPDGCRALTGLRTTPDPTDGTAVPDATTPSGGPAARVATGRAGGTEPAEADGIAIVGVGARFPDAPDLTRYWENLLAGRSAVTEIPADRWDWREHYHPRPTGVDRFRRAHSRWGAFLDGFAEFDPLFFGLTPAEARNVDPQERLFLQACWTAMEDAGYAPAVLPEPLRRRTGVFAGASKQGFALLGLETGLEMPRTSFGSMVNRVSFHLDLGGPSQPVDTACSSALVAVHEACESIRTGRCDLALAGGVNLYLHPSTYVELGVVQMLSDRPDCAAFGARANGIVPGEGVGVVVLKPLAQARRDGDHVYAVIRGSAVNHNGRTSGFTAPSPDGQAEAIRAALGPVDPRTISYVETSVNGSQVGDAVEMTGLTQVFGGRKGAEGEFRMGSVKPNVGHGEASSGMAQLLKVLLAFRHRTIPPTRVPDGINPAIDLNRVPFRLADRAVPWRPVVVDGVPVPLRAGITGVGAGGVNAHLVLEEAPPSDPRPPADRPVVFGVSARTPERLAAYVDRWIAHLRRHPELDVADVAFTVHVGRTPMRHRLAVVAADTAQLRERLETWRATGDAPETVAADAKHPGARAGTPAQRWVAGEPVPWAELGGAPRGRLAGLPTYPFERRVCWVTDPAETDERGEGLPETVAPFAERVPGFSASRVLLGQGSPQESELVRAGQAELRRVLLRGVDLSRVGGLLDLGCGDGRELVALAEIHPDLVLHGVTPEKADAERGIRRVEERDLTDRVAVWHADLAVERFPAIYDLALGVEACGRVRDKEALLDNLDAALVEGGRLLLADQVSLLRGAIVDETLGYIVPTVARWAALLADVHLVLDEVVDVSAEVANFRHDPDVDRHTAHLPEWDRALWRSRANQAEALRRGWIAYRLLRARKDSSTSRAEREETNLARLTDPVPYARVRTAGSAPR